MRSATIGNTSVSGLCIGGNPFSGFSHQNAERNQEMSEYWYSLKVGWSTCQAEN